MPKQTLRRLWETLHEPRTVTLCTIAAYLVAIVMGFSRILAPQPPDDVDILIRVTEAIFLICGGAVGVPTAWRGAQWLEQSAALSVAGGLILVASDMVSVEVRAGLVSPVVTILALLMAAIAMFVRFLRIRHAPYRAGAGPLLPEQRAAVEDALVQDALADDAHDL